MASLKVEMISLAEQATSACKLDKHMKVKVLPCSLVASLAWKSALKFKLL